MLTVRCRDSQVVSQLVERCAETAGRFKLGESEHRVVALLDRSAILLDTIIQILVVAMNNFSTDDPANCLRVGRMFIRRHPQWLLTCTID